MTINPAKLLGLPSGRLEKGAPADLILVDLGQPWVVDKAQIRARSKNSPFDESKMQGRVLTTMVAGNTVYQYAGGRTALIGARARGCHGDGRSCFCRLCVCWRCVVGYLLGSIPFGLLLTQAAGLGDVRKIGSGNIGATNVLRTGHKGLAAATLLLDAAQGHGGGADRLPDRAPLGAVDAFSRPTWRGSALFSAISIRCGSTSGAARGWRPSSACCSASHWPAALVFGLVWLVVALLHALFLAGRAGRRPSRAVRRLWSPARPDCPSSYHGRADLPQAPRQHPPPAGRRGEQDWRPVPERAHCA